MPNGPELTPHPSGGLWLPDYRTFLAADLHLGYGWAQRRRGELGPVADGGVRAKLEQALAELKPSRVVLLGDVYHAPRPSEAERAMVLEALNSIEAELVIVRGNHDRAILRDFQRAPVLDWRAPGILAVHGDAIPITEDYLIVGHFHPVIPVRDAAGVSRRLPVFVMGDRVCVLPAFSPFSAGMPWRELPFDVGGRPRVFAATGKRVQEIRAGAGRARESASSSPG
jgi:metallophosphoesterase superfamily enzyme